MSIKQDIVREYRLRFPKTPTNSLAIKIFKENSVVFKDKENVRYILRYIEGKQGSLKLKSLRDKSLVIDKPRPLNPFHLPESEEVEFEPFIIKGFKKVGLICDLHIPYHSIEAITTALEYLKKEKIDCIIINGDLLDFYQLSRFCKDPRKRNFKGELEAGREFLKVLKDKFGVPIFYKLGNHELRFEKYLFVKAPELLDIEEFKLEFLLRCQEYGCQIIGDKTIIKLGKLNIIHGHEFIGGAVAPVNIARGLYLKGKVSAIQGHNHITSEHTETNMNGEITTTWSVGCLSELHPEYMPLNKWNHGFCLIELEEEKYFRIYNKRIYKGKVY